MFFRQRTVFISHSSANSEIAYQLSGLLQKIGIPNEGVFCSSVLGQGVNNGEKLNDRIYESITRSEVIVFLISDAFINSSYCMEELGIGWFFAFNNSKTCFYMRIPDIEINELSGFVNSKIDKFSSIDSKDDITLFVENICDTMRIKMRKASAVSNDVNTFISAIRDCCISCIVKKSEARTNMQSLASELSNLNSKIAKKDEIIDSYKNRMVSEECESNTNKLKQELHYIQRLFNNLGLPIVRREIIAERKQFFFDMIDRYEELHSLLNIEPSNDSMEKLLSQAYLVYQEYGIAYKHFINSLKIANLLTKGDVEFFAECYPYSLKEAICIVEEKLDNCRQVVDKTYIRDTLQYLKAKEDERQIGNKVTN